MIKEKLGEQIEAIGGQIMTRISASDYDPEVSGEWKVVIPKAITADGFIQVGDMAVEKLKVLPDEKKVTALNDIVIKLSTPFDAALVTEEAVGCVVPSFCAILRKRSDIDINYLLAYLSSKSCKDQFRMRVAGAVMSILSVGKIKDIEIPIPDMATQKEIGERYQKLQEKKKVIRQIVELEEQRNDAVFQELMK